MEEMTHSRSTGADGAEGDPSVGERRERRRVRDDDGVHASLDAVTGRVWVDRNYARRPVMNIVTKKPIFYE